MIFYLYNTALVICYPLLWAYFLAMSIRSDKFSGTLAERYGYYDDSLRKPGVSHRIWIHAVSVGEVVAAIPLAREMSHSMAGNDLVFSTTTKAGKQIIQKTFGGKIPCFYFPFDFPWVARRAVKTIAPDALLLMETELWPNIIRQCAKRKAPVLLLNGRVSDRMAAAKPTAVLLYTWTFKRLSAIGMQTETDAQRIIALGAPKETVTVTGNMKFDVTISDSDLEKIVAVDKIINPRKLKLFTAGSTHPGEEELILDAFAAARREAPDLLLVIAPRHIERAGEVAALAASRGYSVHKRSDMETRAGRDPSPARDAIILDTIGELRYVYAVSTACFVGGSLIERGGHNVLEPAACGKAPFYGPHTANFRDSVRALEENGGGRPVSNARDLAQKLTEILRDDDARLRVDALALKTLKENSGAVIRSLELLRKLI